MFTASVVEYPAFMGKTEYILRNKELTAVVSPGLGGRINALYLSQYPHYNLLRQRSSTGIFNAEFPNYGGDFVWAGPQSHWNWPPIKEHDSMPYTLLGKGRHFILMESAPDPVHGLVVSRRLYIKALRPAIYITDSLTNRSAKPIDCAVWNITQIDTPCLAYIPLKEKDRGNFLQHVFNGDTLMDEAELSDKGFIKRTPERIKAFPYSELWKIGIKSRLNSIQAFKEIDDTLFMLSKQGLFAYKDTMSFPEDCNVQLFNSGLGECYAEIELVSQIKTLQPGESVSLHHTLIAQKI